VERLAAAREPFLIGVRHHSPALAAAIPALLEACRPERVLIELPAELTAWLGWLGHPELEAPVALSVSRADGPLGFYPLGDFSPELAAIRWACRMGVPLEAIDLPAAVRQEHEDDGGAPGPDLEDLWERLVEAPAPGAPPEAVRRSALAVGLAMRSWGPVTARDEQREAYMRSRLGGRAAAVIGAFHAGALLEGPGLAPPGQAEVTTALIPYLFELLDSRSGYPAGIRDPRWRQRVWEALSRGQTVDGVASQTLVEVGRHMRASHHPVGVPELLEALRMARDLASLRGLPAPSRGELLEALHSCLAQGQLLGRGRVLAEALQHVMVGYARGRLPAGRSPALRAAAPRRGAARAARPARP
jgi:hypothetical protein